MLKNKLLVVLGPNASGKSVLAVKLAKKFDGEVVSADSRQVYKGIDIGTGKITKKGMQGIPHHLLDVASPKRRFTVAQYQKKAEEAIKKILKKGSSRPGAPGRGKLPILCGGTGFYIQAVVDGIIIPKVKPDWKLREKLEKQTCQQLFKKLKKLDLKRAKNIDRYNKRRLVRAIEIVHKTKKPVPVLKREQKFNVLMIGIKHDKEVLKERIRKRLLKRLATAGPPRRGAAARKKRPMIEEVKRLRKSGLSWKRLEEFGLEYRYIAYYLQGKIEYEEMVDRIQKTSENLAKRQMTWFKRDKRIIWIKDKKTAEQLVEKFLKN